jgi:hypothetical protein
MRLAAALLLALMAASCSPAPQSSQPEQAESPSAAEAMPDAAEDASAEPAMPETADAMPEAVEAMPEPTAEDLAAIEPAAGGAEEIAPGAGMPMAPSSSSDVAPPPPAPAMMPSAAKSMARSSQSGSKVLSYFQRARTQLDTRRAFGFVLMPKVAVTDEERRVQNDFCEIILASMDFMTPGAVASAPREVMATYWPVVASRASFEIADAFRHRNCTELLAWYDHTLARSLAAKAGVTELTGPLLITWPSGADGDEARDPLIVDFSKANHARATKALQYWFRQLRARPDLWTNRIREGTIRAELADAVNDTAGVVVAVLSGKWDSVNVVMGSN